MPEQSVKLRITQVGGISGTVPLVALSRSDLNEAEARIMDDVSRQLLQMAEAQAAAAPDAPRAIGADIHGYHVEIEDKDGQIRTLRLPYHRPQSRSVESGDIDSIIARLQQLSPSGR